MKRAIFLATVGFGFVASLAMLSSCKKKVGEGKKCKSHSDCKKPLKCVNHLCLDITGNSPACKWSLNCLRKLSETSNPDADKDRAVKWYKKLSETPMRTDCEAIAEKGIAQTQQPWVWKPLCGPPPIKGLVKSGGGNPFKILDYKISGSMIPPDDKLHQKMVGPGHYSDVCKAWVKFELTRRFQGRVVAQFYREYDCQKVEVKEDGKKVKKDQCKVRPYERTDSVYYLYLEEPGTVHELNFYVETPPEICKDRVQKTYPKGCLCLGLSDSKIELKPQEDPFLHPVDFEVAKELHAKRRR